jgi:fibronectin type 3 domain-containing protein
MKSRALSCLKLQQAAKQRRNRITLTPEHLEDRLAPAVINVNPSNYLSLVPTAKPGDTVEFAAGNYASGLNLSGMNGTAGAWITFDGSAGAVILGTASQNTVELDSTSYLVFENFTVDSQHQNDAVKAGGGLSNVSHDILIKNNTILNADSSQQTVGISTKCIAWNWTIQGNTINGAGTGMYLGDSSGFAPFINGIIENNIVENTIGYGIQIKDQEPYALVSGMPSSGTTILRYNQFLNNDIQGALGQGARPNVMIGGFPASGPGASDTYQIYGNLIANNVSGGDYLMQVTGRAMIHDNILINDSVGGIHVQPHYDDSGTLFNPQQISIYDNTIYDVGTGISGAASWPVVGNLIFANNTGAPSGNISDSIANAGLYLTAPSTAPVAANFVPLPGKAQGAAVNLAQFGADPAYNLDYNGSARPNSDTSYGAFEGPGSVVQPPAAPTGLNATAGDGQVSLSWSGSTGATSYNVYRWNGSSYSLLQSVSGASFTDSGLTDGSTYWYEVTAVNSGGESGPSNQVSATLQAAVAYSLNASPSSVATAGTITVNWTAPAGHSTSDWIGLFAVGSSNTSYLDYRYTSGAMSGTVTFTAPATPGSYEFRLLPNNGYASVAVSNPVQVQVPVAAAPSGLSATASAGQIALSWNVSAGATSYNLYRGSRSSGETLLVSGLGGTSYTDSGLSNGTTYFYEVTAVNGGGESVASNEASATTLQPGALPVISKLSKRQGPASGGTLLTIYGTHLTGVTAVYFGPIQALSFTVNANGTITAKAPAEAPGTVDVTVVAAAGTSARSSADQYTFVARPVVTGVSPASGPTAGGTMVTIAGQYLTGATKVRFGKTAARFVVNSDGTITAWSPPEAAGIINVFVVTVGGTSPTSKADHFQCS